MSAPLVVAIDASTTAVKALIFDLDGNVRAEGRRPISLQNPEPDGYEQDAGEWWSATESALTNAVQALPEAERAHIVALCVAHQRETIVVTDAAGTPLAPAVVWMDARCRGEVERAKELLGEERLHRISGKPACTTPSLYKLMHLFARRPELTQTAHVADVHGFLSRRLVGRAVTSLASADPLGLVDMQRHAYDDELLGLLGTSKNQLPELVPVGTPLGTLLPEVAHRTGLPRTTVAYAGAGDGQAACLGAGLTGPGGAYMNLGTAVVCGTLTESYEVDRAFRTLYAATPDRYCLELDLKGGTFTLSWLENLLAKQTSLDELERAAQSLPPGSDGLVLLPYFCGVMNPYWDDDATGLLVGLHGGHTAAHVYRAVLEGIALEQRLGLEGVSHSLGRDVSELIVMGGGSRSDLWCRILADVTGLSVVRSETPEATALGAAIIAAVSAGHHASYAEAARAMTRRGRVFSPGNLRSFYDALYRDVYQGLYSDVAARMQRLGALRRQGSQLA